MSQLIYPTTLSQESSSYIFVTDSGHQYTVYFDKNSPIFPLEELDKNALYFGFTCSPKQEKFERVHDPKIGPTIIWIVANFFQKNKRVILTYVCSPEDTQARARAIAFGKWYNESPLKEKVKLLRRSVGSTYCGVLIGRKNPLMEALEIALEDFNLDKLEPSQVQEDEEDYGDGLFGPDY